MGYTSIECEPCTALPVAGNVRNGRWGGGKLGYGIHRFSEKQLSQPSCWRVGVGLLVGMEGEYAGSISGGCLEAEVVRKAAWMVRGGAVVERYSTLFDDTAEIPFGLGCGGVVDLLLEPADTAECRALLEAME